MKIQLDQIGYRKGNPILENVDLSFPLGTIVGLVAPNGKGKSTLFKGMMNSLALVQGTVSLKDKTYTYPLSDGDQAEFYQYVSMMVDQAHLIGSSSGRRHLTFIKENWRSKLAIDQVIDLLEMGSYVDKKVSSYSLGMKQRLCFAMQIVTDTPVMLMDEVMNSLDIVNVNNISNILLRLREQGKIIFIASHLLDNLSLYCDRVVFIKSRDELLEIGTDHLEQILTLLVKRDHSLSADLTAKGFREPFENKFQIDLNHVHIDEILAYIKDRDIRSVTVGDKSITDYYHDLYL